MTKKKSCVLFKGILGIFIILLLISSRPIINITVVRGESMNPTLNDGDKLILAKNKVQTTSYKRGDLVVFISPEDKTKLLIKRIIGLPGDKINIEKGYVKVNDEYIDEPYIDKDIYTQSLKKGDDYIVPENRIFVIGDNRLPKRSNDSRFFGSISLESVKGKAVFRIYPFNKIQKL